MDDLMARTIVENLSVGIDPLSGKTLRADDCCSNQLIQEALCVVLEHCSLESYGTQMARRFQKNRRQKTPKRKINKAINEKKREEYSRLRQLCRERKSVLEMAQAMNCSVDEVCEKLKQLAI